ncbi:MAG: hypothetical protein R2939_00590 [Kofleriaceae bacterium]
MTRPTLLRWIPALLLAACGGSPTPTATPTPTPAPSPIGHRAPAAPVASSHETLGLSPILLTGGWNVYEEEYDYHARFDFGDDQRFVWGQPTDGDTVDDCPAIGRYEIVFDERSPLGTLLLYPEEDDCDPMPEAADGEVVVWTWPAREVAPDRVLLVDAEAQELPLVRE